GGARQLVHDAGRGDRGGLPRGGEHGSARGRGRPGGALGGGGEPVEDLFQPPRGGPVGVGGPRPRRGRLPGRGRPGEVAGSALPPVPAVLPAVLPTVLPVVLVPVVPVAVVHGHAP